MSARERITRALREPGYALRWALHAPFRPREPTVRTVRYRGARLAVLANDDVGWRLLSQRSFEPRELDALLGLVRPDDVCIDVGANVGVYTALLAQRAPRGRVLAVEPLPVHRHLIGLNCALNGVENVEVVGGVLSDRPGRTSFSVAVDGGFSSLRPTSRRAVADRVEVEALTLDGLVERTGGRADVVKLDVEGAELRVLEGGTRLLGDAQASPRALLVELNAANQAVYGYAPEDVVRFLTKFGYEPHALTARGPAPGWPAPGAAEDVLFCRPGTLSP